jgi:uncharacterized membrane protein YgdD (TMEM256/DUF423 family)
LSSNSKIPGDRVLGIIAGLSGAMAVGMAAWATHGLASDGAAKDLVHKASFYQLIHALALLTATRFGCRAAALLFALGLLLFPTTLYLIALGWGVLPVALTPLGGGAFIAGWLAVAWASYRRG